MPSESNGESINLRLKRPATSERARQSFLEMIGAKHKGSLIPIPGLHFNLTGGE